MSQERNGWLQEPGSASYLDLIDIDRIGPRHWQAIVDGHYIESSRLEPVLIGVEIATKAPLPPGLDRSVLLGLGRGSSRTKTQGETR